MKIPQLKKKPERKSCHNVAWEDNYSWIHQENILEVLKDGSKLLPEVRKYLEEENNYTDHILKDNKEIEKKLFHEIKGRIKLDDVSLPFKDIRYEYWTKTTTKGNYSIKLRKKIGSNEIEEIWNGDKEKEKLKTEYFGIGDLEVSYNDKYLGYSLDLKGSEYYTIYLRDILTGKEITEKIEETSGSITFSLDDKYIFYSKLDEFHRPRKSYRHKIGTSIKNDELIFAGDLINRGPKSLEVLEFCLKNKKSIEVVLGNHDIYLLYLIHQNKKNFQLAPILESKNKKKFFNWLIEKPLMIERKNNKNEKFVISHAGIPHIWDIEDARRLNEEYLNAMKNNPGGVFRNMWGDHPDLWSENLKGFSRIRVIINYFTRMRLITQKGKVDLKTKISSRSSKYKPWFEFVKNEKDKYQLFGHWAALKGKTNKRNIIGLDAGCVWGGHLKAIRINDRKIFKIKSL